MYGNLEYDFVTALNHCKNSEQSWHTFLQFVAKLGFDCAFFGLTFSAHNDNLPGLYLSNYHDDFLTDYDKLSGAYDRVTDTAIQWCFDNDQPLQWNSAEHFALTTPQSSLVDQLANDFGMAYGMSIPIRSRSHLYIGGFGVCAQGVSQKTYDNDIIINAPIAVKLANIYHAYVSNIENGSLFMPSTRTSMKQVTDLELETLKLLAAGFTIKEIAATRLFKSVESVNLYIKSAKQKLQVKTRDQLIARAIVLGVI